MVSRLIFSLDGLRLFLREFGWFCALEVCLECVSPTKKSLPFAFTEAQDLGKTLILDLCSIRDAMFCQALLELRTYTGNLRNFDLAAFQSFFDIGLL